MHGGLAEKQEGDVGRYEQVLETRDNFRWAESWDLVWPIG